MDRWGSGRPRFRTWARLSFRGLAKPVSYVCWRLRRRFSLAGGGSYLVTRGAFRGSRRARVEATLCEGRAVRYTNPGPLRRYINRWGRLTQVRANSTDFGRTGITISCG